MDLFQNYSSLDLGLSLFEKNSADVLCLGNSFFLDSCQFENNISTSNLLQCDTFICSNTLFEGNDLKSNLLTTYDDRVVKHYNILSSTFNRNKIGSIMFSFDGLNMENSSITNNEAHYLWINSGNSKFTLNNNTIIGNTTAGLFMLSCPVNLLGNVILGNFQASDNNNMSILSNEDKYIRSNMMNVILTGDEVSADDDKKWVPDNETNFYVQAFKSDDNCAACAYAEQETEEYHLTNLFDGSYNS
ncbi:MAG TPA: hypothetical protein PLN63_04405 [Paludibacteraceae bacterium]|nr:hypothetical protein [Paludibacteraceae bacterium]